MAIVKFEDGSKLELQGEELVLYLKATGKYVEPKSQAQQVADKMAEIRNAEAVSKEDVVAVGQLVNDAIKEFQGEGKDKVPELAKQPHPAATMPRKLGAVVSKPKNLRIPVTDREYEVIRVLREYHRMNHVKDGVGLTTIQVAKVLEASVSSVSGFLSGLFQDQRGVLKSVKNTWVLAPWALAADWDIQTRPNSHWPPKEGIPS
ncbi:hypothetical protein SEA_SCOOBYDOOBYDOO_244 [Mycobacterium phage ScoobyDoobyDoo]|nr:hypothetical protein SEA_SCOOBYDOOBYDOO_244 [Mycobacterium phage ScoobyDoobyDoo]